MDTEPGRGAEGRSGCGTLENPEGPGLRRSLSLQTQSPAGKSGYLSLEGEFCHLSRRTAEGPKHRAHGNVHLILFPLPFPL